MTQTRPELPSRQINDRLGEKAPTPVYIQTGLFFFNGPFLSFLLCNVALITPSTSSAKEKHICMKKIVSS